MVVKCLSAVVILILLLHMAEAGEERPKVFLGATTKTLDTVRFGSALSADFSSNKDSMCNWCCCAAYR